MRWAPKPLEVVSSAFLQNRLRLSLYREHQVWTKAVRRDDSGQGLQYFNLLSIVERSLRAEPHNDIESITNTNTKTMKNKIQLCKTMSRRDLEVYYQVSKMSKRYTVGVLIWRRRCLFQESGAQTLKAVFQSLLAEHEATGSEWSRSDKTHWRRKQSWTVMWSFSTKKSFYLKDKSIELSIISLLERQRPPSPIIWNTVMCAIDIAGNKSQGRVIESRGWSWRGPVPINPAQDWHEYCPNNPFPTYAGNSQAFDSAHKIIYVEFESEFLPSIQMLRYLYSVRLSIINPFGVDILRSL